MFFKEQERDMSFFNSVDASGWDSSETFAFNAKGIVSYSSVGISSDVVEDFGSTNIRIFLTKAFKEDSKTIKENDVVVIDDVRFEISKIDSRGVLPSKYPVRIEAVRKI